MARPIQLREARTNNLKNISCEIPRGKVVAVTGPSGSGKSSLVLGTLLAEAKRRIVAPLGGSSAEIGGSISQVASISGLSYPIQFSSAGATRRLETVFTLSGLAPDVERFFFEHGERHCRRCGTKLPAVSLRQVIEALLGESDRTSVQVLSPVPSADAARAELLKRAISVGYTRGLSDDVPGELESFLTAASLHAESTLYIFIDSVAVDRKRSEERLRADVQLAEKLSDRVLLRAVNAETELRSVWYSSIPVCSQCGEAQPRLVRESFSYLRRQGRCRECLGSGEVLIFRPEAIIDETSPLLEGGIRAWGSALLRPAGSARSSWLKALKIRNSVSFSELSAEKKQLILFGSRGINRYPLLTEGESSAVDSLRERGVCGQLMLFSKRHAKTVSETFATHASCPVCNGLRLRTEAGLVTLGGKSFWDVLGLPIQAVTEWFLGCTGFAAHLEQARERVSARLRLLENFGLAYLSLARAGRSLSAGERQRVELARELGSAGRGLLYLIDEPSAGLHPRDLEHVVRAMVELGERDAAVIVTDHHEQVIGAAEHILEFGPRGGEKGGELVFQGGREAFQEQRADKGMREAVRVRLDISKLPQLTATGLKGRNLKNITLHFPLQCLVGVCGVSGSGKSTALFDSVGPAVAEVIRARGAAIDLSRWKIDSLGGVEGITRVALIDRLRLGGYHPRSNVGSALGIWPVLQRHYALAPEARIKGLTAADFQRARIASHKSAFGDALHTVWRGKRYSEIIGATADELSELFRHVPRLGETLGSLVDLGLGYLNMSQPLHALSTGEQERLRLVGRLIRRGTGTLYILDEPTRGLGRGEIRAVLELFRGLIARGNSIVVIEHRPEFLTQVDYLIELGPGAGEQGGAIVAQGSPEDVHANPESLIGKYLAG